MYIFYWKLRKIEFVFVLLKIADILILRFRGMWRDLFLPRMFWSVIIFFWQLYLNVIYLFIHLFIYLFMVVYLFTFSQVISYLHLCKTRNLHLSSRFWVFILIHCEWIRSWVTGLGVRNCIIRLWLKKKTISPGKLCGLQ